MNKHIIYLHCRPGSPVMIIIESASIILDLPFEMYELTAQLYVLCISKAPAINLRPDHNLHQWRPVKVTMFTIGLERPEY